MYKMEMLQLGIIGKLPMIHTGLKRNFRNYHTLTFL